MMRVVSRMSGFVDNRITVSGGQEETLCKRKNDKRIRKAGSYRISEWEHLLGSIFLKIMTGTNAVTFNGNGLYRRTIDILGDKISEPKTVTRNGN